MRGAHSISTRRAYGLQRICRVWHCARSSVYARRQATTSQVPCRRQLWVEGIRTSQERVRRLMREHDLQAPHRVGRAHVPKVHDGTITTEVPDVMWGTDILPR